MPVLLGRAGESPLVGCAFYAGSAGAVACTGIGEYILPHNLALRVYFELERGTPLAAHLTLGFPR
jgi:L-asparaginase/beta-aspartyl-peptidase (threonine type)